MKKNQELVPCLFGWKLSGSDNRKFLNNFCSANVVDLEKYQPVEGFILDGKGQVIVLATIFFDGSDLFLLSVGDGKTDLVQHLDKYIITEDVCLHRLGEVSAFWAFPEDSSPADLLSDQDRNSNLAFFSAVKLIESAEDQEAGPNFVLESKAGGNGCMIVRLAEEQDTGFDVQQWKNDLCGKLDLKEICELFCVVRVGCGFPATEAEISETTLPQEMNRDQASINFNKGCYLGQETVARLDALGRTNWVLLPVNLTDSEEELENSVDQIGRLQKPWTAKIDGKVVAKLTSAASCAKENKMVGLSLVRRGKLTKGDTVVFAPEANDESGTVSATFV